MTAKVDARLAPLLTCGYVENGRDVTQDGGLDCWGFVRECWRRLDREELPEHVVADESMRSPAFRAGMESPAWRRLDSPMPFCLAVFLIPGQGHHVGIVLPCLTHFLHCRRPTAAVDALDDRLWARCLKGYYEHVT